MEGQNWEQRDPLALGKSSKQDMVGGVERGEGTSLGDI